jgi:hypothetical protein
VNPRWTLVSITISAKRNIFTCFELRLVIEGSQGAGRTDVVSFWDEFQSTERTEDC